MGAAVWQSTSLDNFTFESISLELFAFRRECSGLFTGLFTGKDLPCDQITPVCYGRLGDDTIVSCEDKIQVGVSILPLICWQGQGDRNKRNSC